MALVGNCIPSKNDVFFEFPAAYARVLSVTSENVANAVSFIKVEIHADQSARSSAASTTPQRSTCRRLRRPLSRPTNG